MIALVGVVLCVTGYMCFHIFSDLNKQFLCYETIILLRFFLVRFFPLSRRVRVIVNRFSKRRAQHSVSFAFAVFSTTFPADKVREKYSSCLPKHSQHLHG